MRVDKKTKGRMGEWDQFVFPANLTKQEAVTILDELDELSEKKAEITDKVFADLLAAVGYEAKAEEPQAKVDDKEEAPPKEVKAEEPDPATKETPAPNMVTMEQAMAMAEKAAEKASGEAVQSALSKLDILIDKEVAKRLASMPSQSSQAVIHAHKAEEKPDFPRGNRVPDEFFSQEELIVFHSGSQFVFDGFIADGRVAEPPRSKMIRFESVGGANIRRFGDAERIQYTCQYKTRDIREIEMFRNDVRWGSEFWDGSGTVLDDQHELGMITAEAVLKLNSLGFEQLRQMSIDRGLPISDMRSMQARIAVQDATNQMRRQAKSAQDRLDQAEKVNKVLIPSGT